VKNSQNELNYCTRAPAGGSNEDFRAKHCLVFTQEWL